MTLRNILVFPDPRLREVAQEVKIFDEELKSLSEDLLETMYEFKGIGLAATQIGVPKRIIVIDISEEKDEPQIFINPKIKVLEEEEKAGYEEGCLSVPSFYEEVIRPVNVEISFNDLDGRENKIKPAGLLGVVIQHETDHLDGKLFIDYLGTIKRQLITRKMQKFKREMTREGK